MLHQFFLRFPELKPAIVQPIPGTDQVDFGATTVSLITRCGHLGVRVFGAEMSLEDWLREYLAHEETTQEWCESDVVLEQLFTERPDLLPVDIERLASAHYRIGGWTVRVTLRSGVPHIDSFPHPVLLEDWLEEKVMSGELETRMHFQQGAPTPLLAGSAKRILRRHVSIDGPSPPRVLHSRSARGAQPDLLDTHLEDFFRVYPELLPAGFRKHEHRPGCYFLGDGKAPVQIHFRNDVLLARVGGGFKTLKGWLEERRAHALGHLTRPSPTADVLENRPMAFGADRPLISSGLFRV
jgi:hypothetical protein